VSKERARARAERQAAAAARAETDALRRERAAAVRERRGRRVRWWRAVRLWQHGPAFRRNRGTWGALGTLVLGVLLVVYLFSRSVDATLVAALVCLVASPVLVMLFFDRSRK
jgi:hypothetical protein